MTNWPTAPLIRVIHGREYNEPVHDGLAARVGDGKYLLATGPRAGNSILRKTPSDDIDEWEDVTAVPTAALEDFKAAWKGFGMYDPDDSQRVTDAITTILSHLPAGKPGALDRAVTRVKDAGGPMVDAETLPAERLSLLMDALASVQSAARKTAPLTMVARICADWVQADKEEVVAVEQMRSRARSMPEVIGSDPARFLVLAGIVGETASMLGDGHPSVSGELINAGTYALAWAAQTIEEEDR
jgi:hypothetical protein|nr:MAG TPA: hypothetical protein [Caudoviricetes sp.]